MEIEIRKAEREDAVALKLVEEACGLEPWDTNAYCEAVTTPEFYLVVAVHEGEIVGFLLMRLITTQPCPGSLDITLTLEVEILNIGVLPDFRNHGVASSIFVSAIKSLPRSNGLRVYLEVRISNAAAIKFYSKMGFRKTGLRPGFYVRPSEDALIMTWERDKVLAVDSDSALLSEP